MVPAMVYAGQKQVLGKTIMVWNCLCIGHGSPTIAALWP